MEWLLRYHEWSQQLKYQILVLIPLKEKDNIIYVNKLTTIWIDVNIPENCKPGIYTVIFKVKSLTESDYEG